MSGSNISLRIYLNYMRKNHKEAQNYLRKWRVFKSSQWSGYYREAFNIKMSTARYFLNMAYAEKMRLRGEHVY